VTIKCVRRKILFSGFSGQKSPNGMGKISIPGVPSACSGQALRLRATERGVPR
jgi:hypothetical protein